MCAVRRKYEKPSKGSNLTVKQHVWPLASIARFADGTGTVCLFDKVRSKARRALPDDSIFCARRVWDQRAESGYMAAIEVAFQNLANEVVSGGVTSIGSSQKVTVDAFFALW
jgi:hypothetical protein